MSEGTESHVKRAAATLAELVDLITAESNKGCNILILGQSGVGKSHLASAAFPGVRVVEGIKYRHRPMVPPAIDGQKVYLVDETDYFPPEFLQSVMRNALRAGQPLVIVNQGHDRTEFAGVLRRYLAMWMPFRPSVTIEIHKRVGQRYEVTIYKRLGAPSSSNADKHHALMDRLQSPHP